LWRFHADVLLEIANAPSPYTFDPAFSASDVAAKVSEGQ
jgi:hypothetical protein